MDDEMEREELTNAGYVSMKTLKQGENTWKTWM
jgi:hypothetical protein